MTTSSMYVAERRRVWRERADVADDCPNLVDACRVPPWFSVVSVNRIVKCMKWLETVVAALTVSLFVAANVFAKAPSIRMPSLALARSR